MNTVNKKEIEKFEKLAEEWWDPFGKFKPLHQFNPIRLEFIRDSLVSHFKINNHLPELFENLNILDIGCGGGILSEPMARLGAKMTGVDASKKNIEVAKIHASKMNLNINYIKGSLDQIKFKNKFDVILNMEIVEHVSNIDSFIQSCSKLIKDKGVMFVATINKNLKSYLFAILGAEYILRWLPIGTHDWNKFLTPRELEIIANKNNFKTEELVGIKFNLFSKSWYKSTDVSVNYISTFLVN